MLAKVLSSAALGVEAYLVDVEVDIAQGLPNFNTVGLPDAAVKESRDRVRAAIKNCGFDFPARRITVNLAPADIKKEGACFDLPIACAILAAMGLIKPDRLQSHLLLGELALDGGVRGITGAMPMAVAAARSRLAGMILPAENAPEAAVVEGIQVFGVETLPQVVEFLNGAQEVPPTRIDLQDVFAQHASYGVDLADVKGQAHAKRALEVLRQPLEDGNVTIARAATSVTYPARFMLAAAMNPCPCGYFTSPQQIQRYRSRISGPLLDRIDLHLDVPPLRYRELTTDSQGEPSEQVRMRVKHARAAQQERFRQTRTFCNAQMGVKQIRRHCPIGPDGQALLETAIERLGLSARAHDRILKVARTIADLEGYETIRIDHLAEAIQYRTLDRHSGW